jgi:CheY-like chemotaxis protein
MQLQTFSTGGEPITRAIAIGDFVRDSADLVLSGSMVASELELEAGLWPAEADAAQIGQVFENLLLNARQCQPDGGWIRIEGRNRVVGEEADGLGVDPGRYVSFTIADGGPGITEEDRHRIFDPFFTTKDGGSGLGLATALSIVRRHGGSLDVDPPDGNAPEGRGAVFRVLLPASESPVARKVEPPAALPSPESRRVLVIDDDAHIRPLLVRMLERLGHRAEAARSCDEALALQARSLEEDRPFRMAVIDLTLPGDVSGPEILASLRERQPELVAVAISGHSEDSVLARPTDFGFDLALTKPFRLSDVARTLHELDRARTSPAD